MATAICLPLAPKKRSSRAPPFENWCQLWMRGLCSRESSEPKTEILHEVSPNKIRFQMHSATTPTNAPSLGYNPLIHNYYQFLNQSKIVRSILLLVVQVSPDNTRFGVRAESWGTKFSAPRRRRAGNAYVMTSSVERVEVLAGVLIVLSISYGKVSTAEVMVEVDSIDLLSCGAGVAADARACVYRFVRGRERTRDEDGRRRSVERV
jgi:hypothetical protein